MTELQTARNSTDIQLLHMGGNLANVSTRLETVERATLEKIEGVSCEIAGVRRDLTGRMENLSQADGVPFQGADLNAWLNEIEDRLSRRRNVIVYNVPEPTGGEARARGIKDTEALSGIFKDLQIPVDMERARHRRLGKFSRNLARPRPIKLILSSEDQANNLVITASQKRSHRDLTGPRPNLILPDLTEMQRTQNKQLTAELVKRKASEGNENLKIMTRNGIKKIVSVARRRPPRRDPLQQNIHQPQPETDFPQ